MALELSPWQTDTAIFIYCDISDLDKLPEPIWRGPDYANKETCVQFPRDAKHIAALALCGLKFGD